MQVSIDERPAERTRIEPVPERAEDVGAWRSNPVGQTSVSNVAEPQGSLLVPCIQSHL